MAQSDTIEMKILVDLSQVEAARRRVRRVIAEAKEASRDLAQLEEQLIGLGGRLQEFGIDLVLEDV
jgi:hypothetical protein